MEKNVFAVCGTIGAGKTTLLKALQKEIKDLTVFYETPDVKILKKYYAGLEFMENFNYYFITIVIFLLFFLIFNKYLCFLCVLLLVSSIFLYYMTKGVCFETQIYFLGLRKKNIDSKVQGLIGKDRSFLEDKLFPLTQLKQGFISKKQYKIYKGFYDEYCKDFLTPKIWIYLDLSPERALINLKDRDIEKKISLKYLKLLGEEYEKWKLEMKQKYPKRFIIVNVNNGFVKTNEIIKILRENDFFSSSIF